MKPALSLVIAVYNKPRFIEFIFNSLKNQTFKDFEVVIADDGSGDEVKKVIDKFQNQFAYPIVHCWHEDIGFRKTIIVNKAVALTKADYLVLIDGDCILHHKFLAMHYRHRNEHHILSGRRINLNREITDRLTNEDICSKRIEKYTTWIKHMDYGSARRGFMIPFGFYIDNTFRKNYTILGCNQSMFKSSFIAVNGYNEDILGRGAEDSNIEARLKLKGYRIMNLSKRALQYHLYHDADPGPHDPETVFKLFNPESHWVKDGIDKYLR
jgi:glycosyltransferase involved in cell wall biosynthesis